VKVLLEAVAEEAVDDRIDAAVAVAQQLKVGHSDAVRARWVAFFTANQQIDLNRLLRIT